MKVHKSLSCILHFVMFVAAVGAEETPMMNRGARTGTADLDGSKHVQVRFSPFSIGLSSEAEKQVAIALKKYPENFLSSLGNELRYCEELIVGGHAARAYVEGSTIYVSMRNQGQPLTNYELEQAMHFAVGIRIVRQRIPAAFWEEWHSLLRKKYTNEPHLRGALPTSDDALQMGNNLLRQGYLAQVSTSSAESDFAFTFSRMMAEGWRIGEQVKEYGDVRLKVVLVWEAMSKLDNRFLTNMYEPLIKEYRRLESDEISPNR